MTLFPGSLIPFGVLSSTETELAVGQAFIRPEAMADRLTKAVDQMGVPIVPGGYSGPEWRAICVNKLSPFVNRLALQQGDFHCCDSAAADRHGT